VGKRDLQKLNPPTDGGRETQTKNQICLDLYGKGAGKSSLKIDPARTPAQKQKVMRVLRAEPVSSLVRVVRPGIQPDRTRGSGSAQGAKGRQYNAGQGGLGAQTVVSANPPTGPSSDGASTKEKGGGQRPREVSPALEKNPYGS